MAPEWTSAFNKTTRAPVTSHRKQGQNCWGLSMLSGSTSHVQLVSVHRGSFPQPQQHRKLENRKTLFSLSNRNFSYLQRKVFKFCFTASFPISSIQCYTGLSFTGCFREVPKASQCLSWGGCLSGYGGVPSKVGDLGGLFQP